MCYPFDSIFQFYKKQCIGIFIVGEKVNIFQLYAKVDILLLFWAKISAFVKYGSINA